MARASAPAESTKQAVESAGEERYVQDLVRIGRRLRARWVSKRHVGLASGREQGDML